MKIANKVATGAGLLLILFAVALVHQLGLVDRLVKATRELSTARAQAARGALSVMRLAAETEELLRKQDLLNDPRYDARAAESTKMLGDELAALAKLELSTVEGETLGFLVSSWEIAQPQLDAGTLRLLGTQAESLLAATEAAMAAEALAADEAGTAAARAAGVAVAMAVALALVVVVLTVRAIRAPLRRLVDGTRRVAEGDFDVALDTSRDDEFSRLAADFNAMAERLGELDQVKKDLLSHVSHELKTPLATIQETHRLLLEEVPGPLNVDQSRLLTLNLRSSERLSRLISKLLDLSRLDAGAVEYDFRVRPVVDLVESAVAELAPRAQDAEVQIEIEARPAVSGEDITARCDGDRLVQVVENLVENAIKFSSAGGTVTICTAYLATLPSTLPAAWRQRLTLSPNGYVEIAVTDRGPGVPAGEETRIFEKFHQAGGRRGGAVGGAGLGLAICREIVEAHRGAIWTEANASSEVPRGSIFRVLLPAASA